MATTEPTIGKRPDPVYIVNKVLDIQQSQKSGLFNTNDWLTQAKLGNIPGLTFSFIVGSRDGVDTTNNTVWAGSPARYSFLTTPSQLLLSSTSVNDTFGGTGANAVLVFYLDGNKDEASEVVLMNGQTQVATVATDISRIQFILVIIAGSVGGNDGDIYIGTGAAVGGVPPSQYGIITNVNGIPENISRQAVKTVPRDHLWIADDSIFTSSDNQFMQFVPVITPEGSLPVVGPLLDLVQGGFEIRTPLQAPLLSGTDFEIVARTTSGISNARFYLPYIDFDLDVYNP